VREPSLDGFRAFGRVPDHDQRPLENGALFLNPAGVGDQEAREPGEGEERPVVGWRDGAQPVERGGEPMPFGRGAGARMQGKQHRQPQLAELVEDRPQSLRVVGVLRAVDRRQDVLPGFGAEPGYDLPGSGVVGQHAEGCLDDRVAGQHDLSGGDALGNKVGHCAFGRGTVQVGEDADKAPVDLLRHRAIMGAQARLDMHDRRARVVCGLRGGRDRVRVALDQDRGWRPFGEHVAEHLDHPGDLSMARLAADAGQGFRLGQVRAGQEHAGEFLVAVLAGMQEPGRRAQDADNGRELDYFGPCSDHNSDVRRISFL